ncbi:MAG: flagellar basal body-associated FliL family protein [Bdellovibrionales bacterium]|nr:flagellar basal body-associated FliL family protein [Bdellovibrionales bacterium]
MADEKAAAAPAPAEAAPAAGGNQKLLMGVMALNLVVMIAVVVVLFLGQKKKQETPSLDQIAQGAAQGAAQGGHGAAPAEGALVADSRFFSLGDVLTNLSGPASSNYVKININFEVSKDADEEDLKKRKPQMRDRIISILNAKKPAELSSADGQNALKEEIRAVVNSTLTKGKVEGVYFSSFVIN